MKRVLLGLLIFSVPSIAVACPSAASVLDELERVAPDHGLRTQDLQIEDEGETVEVKMVLGGVLHSRLLPARSGCDERATMAAVVLASWLSDVRGPVPNDPFLPEPDVQTRRERAEVPPDTEALSEAKSRSRSHWLLAGGPALAVGTFGLGASFGGSWQRRHRGLALRTHLRLPESATLGPGEVSWWRASAAFLGMWRLWGNDGSALWVEAGPAFSRTVARGVGFTKNGDDAVGGWGASASIGWQRRQGSVGVWFGTRVQVWQQRATVFASEIQRGDRLQHELPAWDLGLAAEIVWGSSISR